MKILVADDTKSNLAVLYASLVDLGHTVWPVSSGEEAVELFKNNHPDLIILDVVMKGMDGFECARQIRAYDPKDWIPIIFLSADVNDTSIAKGIDAGGDDYLTKPFSPITLAAKIRAMERIADIRNSLFALSQKLTILASTDSLTGLYNRLQFERVLKEKIAESEREKTEVALMFLDLDKFKPVNDTYGHSIGDELLRLVAERLKKCVRVNDCVARLGGDEFAIVFSQFFTDETINIIASKVLKLLSEPFIIENQSIQITSCIGISIYPKLAKTYEDLIRNADAAMYKVKQMGRNNFSY